MSAQSHLFRLYVRDNRTCHYCPNKVWLAELGMYGNSKNQATRDHVVPKCFGGRNNMDNYVLACAGCNNKRQHDLDWCNCDFCGPRLRKFKSSDRFFETAFTGLMKFNRPEIKKRSRGWMLYVNHQRFAFDTWDEAMAFVDAGIPVERKIS